jgi:putative lipoic acid-binding regulatory protein
MGNYDPVQAETDNETTDGNILEALMNFPTMYAFNIVGRTSGDDEVTKKYIDDVNEVVLEISGDKELQFNTVPRGKSFTKITVEASVESSSMITLIYEKLAELELTVMRF